MTGRSLDQNNLFLAQKPWSKKRKRPNWSSDEIAVLKDLATEYATILEKNMTTLQVKKQKGKYGMISAKTIQCRANLNAHQMLPERNGITEKASLYQQ